MTTTTEPTATELATKLARRYVSRAIATLAAWLAHPSYNTRTAVLEELRDARVKATALYALTIDNDLAYVSGTTFGVAWNAYDELVEVVRETREPTMRASLEARILQHRERILGE